MQKPYLGEELTEVVRRWATTTTPEELKARGVRSVRSVSMNRVAGLIEKAVNRTLLSRTLGGTDDEHHAFSEAAREEFVRMVRGIDEGQRSESLADSPAETALDRLKQDLRTRRAELHKQQTALSADRGASTHEDGELEQRLRRVFAAWGAEGSELTPMQEEIVRVSIAELRAERRRSRQVLIDQHRKEMDILERRLTKLSIELERTEAELARMAARGIQAENAGIASEYTEVQGLPSNDGDYERKGALMSAIFEANLELQAKLAAPLQLARPEPRMLTSGPAPLLR